MSFEFSKDQLDQMRTINDRADEVARRIQEASQAAGEAERRWAEQWAKIVELAKEAARQARGEERPFRVRVIKQQYFPPKLPFAKKGRVEETEVERGWKIATQRVANHPINDMRHPGPSGPDTQQGLMLSQHGQLAIYNGAGEPDQPATVLAYSLQGKDPSVKSRNPFYLEAAPAGELLDRYLPRYGPDLSAPLAVLEHQLLRFVTGHVL